MIVEDKTTVPAIDRAFDILEMLSSSGPIGYKEIIKRLSLPQASAARIMKRLCVRGYALKNQKGLYEVGPAIVALQKSESTAAQLCRVAEPLLKQLQEMYSHSLILLHWTGTAWKCIAKIQDENSLSMQPVGETRVDIYNYPWGAFAHEQLLKEDRKLMLKYDATDLKTRLETYKAHGYVFEKGKIFSRFSTPIHNKKHDLMGALVLSFDTQTIKTVGAKRIAEEMLLRCDEIKSAIS